MLSCLWDDAYKRTLAVALLVNTLLWIKLQVGISSQIINVFLTVIKNIFLALVNKASERVAAGFLSPHLSGSLPYGII